MSVPWNDTHKMYEAIDNLEMEIRTNFHNLKE